jgi:hypothetical protein
MTADLAAWLLADDGPIAEDERWARDALMKGDWNGAMRLHDYREPVGQHIARWNPARVLAECAAKRIIIRETAGAGDAVAVHPNPADVEPWAESMDIILRALAEPYAGRAGWRDEWAT